VSLVSKTHTWSIKPVYAHQVKKIGETPAADPCTYRKHIKVRRSVFYMVGAFLEGKKEEDRVCPKRTGFQRLTISE